MLCGEYVTNRRNLIIYKCKTGIWDTLDYMITRDFDQNSQEILFLVFTRVYPQVYTT